jgi:F-type H+-transporting ATPase subunit b
VPFDWVTFGLQTVNFGILVWLLHRFLYKPVLKLVDARRADIERRFAEATAAEEKAKAKLAEITAERAGMAAEREALLKAAEAEAAALAATRSDEAERSLQSRQNEARKLLAEERERALAELRRQLLDLGLDIARRLLTDVPDSCRAAAWLDEIEHRLAGLDPAERETIRTSLRAGTTLQVVTALPLPDAARAEWGRRLRRALAAEDPAPDVERDFELDFTVDPALIAGAELHAPAGILRLSWAGALATIRRELEDYQTTLGS